MYTIKQMADLAGVSPRTLRHYEALGLLRPHRNRHNDYRLYSSTDVDALQRIMFFRQLDVPLKQIKEILFSPGYDDLAVLDSHLKALEQQQLQLASMIENLKITIACKKGERQMKDSEKFEGLKKQLVKDNEEQYGEELRQKYGNATIEQSNEKLMGMSSKQYEHAQALSEQINDLLRQECPKGNPGSGGAQHLCALHAQWISLYWRHYSKEAHLSLARSYVEDERFKAYYDAVIPGGADFLYAAIMVYCSPD